MINDANQLLALNDEEFIEALFESCCGRPADAEELSYYLDELRSGRGKPALIAKLAQMQAGNDRRFVLRGLEDVVVAHERSKRRGIMGWSRDRDQVRRQMNRLENTIGRILQRVSQMERDIQGRLAKIETALIGGTADLPLEFALSTEEQSAPMSSADAIVEADARTATTSAELAALSPVAGQILREISLGLAKTSDSASI
jgi:hypothetical protein